MGLTRIALKRPVSTLLVVLAIFVFGFSSLMGLRLELMPDMDMPIMMVYTLYPGADPESVEELVSKEIEGDVASLSGVDTVYSYSMENYSMVMLRYDYDTDTNDAYIDLRAALDAADLPDDASEPTVMQMDVNSMASISYSVSLADGSDALAYVNDELVPELESVGTVASVDVTGGRENYIRVLLDEEALSQYGLSMSTVASYIAANDFTVPLGSLEQGSQSISAISTADVETVQALKEVPLYTSSGQLIQLSDVAEVSWEEEAADSISRFNGEETVTVSVTKNQTASTLGMISDVEDIMEEMSEENENLIYETSYDASELIIQSISSVASTLVIGVILSMLILFLFFGDIRASVIVGFSMPISLMVTIILMAVLGFSLNIITMGGLVIAIGMMVDNSIVMIDGCFRGRDRTEGLTEAALFASKSVAGSIFAGTLTTVVIYIPICLQSGMAGQMLGQLGYTIIFSLSASLISALTLVPLFYRMFKPRERKELKINSALDAVKKKYDPMVRGLLRHKGLTVAVSVLALVGAFALAAFGLDMEIMPSTDEGSVSIEATLRPGTKVEDVDEQIAEIEAMVAAHEDVESYTVTVESGSASISVNLKDDRKMTSQEVADEWTEATKDIMGMQLEVTVSSMMSSLMSSETGGEVNLASTDLDELTEAVELIEEEAWDVPGVLNVYNSAGFTSTQIEIVIDPLEAMSHGMTAYQVAGSLYSLISGTEAMTITSNGDEYSVMLEFPEGTYTDASSLLNATVSGVPLSEMAELRYTDSQQTIIRENERYTMSVTAVCLSGDVDAVQDGLDAVVANMELPDSVELTQSMTEETMSEMFGSMGTAIVTALFLVFLVMAMQFESPKYSLMVMISIPFSLIGAFLLIFITGQAISITSLMGVLTLVGTVVNNGILYVDSVAELQKEMPLEDAVVGSGQTRLRPMLMTTLTTVIAMIPMAMGIGTGNAMMQGMAITIIGGLVAATILILVLFPVFYTLLYGRGTRRERRKKKEELATEQ